MTLLKRDKKLKHVSEKGRVKKNKDKLLFRYCARWQRRISRDLEFHRRNFFVKHQKERRLFSFCGWNFVSSLPSNLQYTAGWPNWRELRYDEIGGEKARCRIYLSSNPSLPGEPFSKELTGNKWKGRWKLNIIGYFDKGLYRVASEAEAELRIAEPTLTRNRALKTLYNIIRDAEKSLLI